MADVAYRYTVVLRALMRAASTGHYPKDYVVHAPILIVEDDPAIRSFITAVLSEEGLPVATVEDGAAAIEWLRQQRPALVILDLELPKIPGEGVLREVRAIYHDQVPVITMTAQLRRVADIRARGASTHLAKPFMLDALIAAVYEHLEG